jgi:hypothetical protein
MPTKNTATTICSFCLKEFPDKELYIVSLPVNRGDVNSYHNTYGTPCCPKCIDGEDKERYIEIIEQPISKRKSKGAKD